MCGDRRKRVPALYLLADSRLACAPSAARFQANLAGRAAPAIDLLGLMGGIAPGLCGAVTCADPCALNSTRSLAVATALCLGDRREALATVCLTVHSIAPRADRRCSLPGDAFRAQRWFAIVPGRAVAEAGEAVFMHRGADGTMSASGSRRVVLRDDHQCACR